MRKGRLPMMLPVPRFITGLLAVVFLVPLAIAEEGRETVADEAGLLYSSQVLFGTDGFPQVTIGLMDGQQSVRLSSPEGLVLTYMAADSGDTRQTTLDVVDGASRGFEIEDATGAKVTYRCGVASLRFNEKSLLDKRIAMWRTRGERVQVFETGSVFGIRGHVIDNRTYVLAIRSFANEDEARRAAAGIFDRFGTRTFVHAHLSRRPSGTIRVIDESGKRLALASDLVTVRPAGSGPISVRRVEYGKGYRWHGFEDRRYAGTILITFDRNGRLAVVNRVGVERLLDGLVPVEINPAAPMEALKAQAVVARGEVFAKIGARHFMDPYLLCAATHCQVYSGVDVEKDRPGRAVRSTRGELLFLGAKLVDSVYSASCGGHTENNDTVWSDPPSPALRGIGDMPLGEALNWPSPESDLHAWLTVSPPVWCRLSTLNREGLFRWSKVISSEEMDRLVAKVKPIGQVVSIQVLSRGVSGRVKVVRVVGTGGDLLVQREWPVRQLFGNLRSGMFEVEVQFDAEQMPIAFSFHGGGWGHGVGLCQIGAVGMAEHAHDYGQILGHYYGGARVFRLYGAIRNLAPGSLGH